MSRPKFGKHAAIAVVIANMIGTGVFTSLGFQLQLFDSGFVLLALWFVGGLCALCGALTYAELGARMPQSGGEYVYLKKIFHPSLGFMAGWVSLTVGFAAPVALVGMTFGEYLSSAIPAINPTMAALILIITVTVIHLFTYRTSGNAQTLLTYLKVAVIVGFCGLCIYLAPSQPIEFTPQAGDFGLLTSGGFAVALVYVSYSYLGWNAANYLTAEWQGGTRTLTISLIVGTSLVTLAYLLLNYTFLATTPTQLIRGELEVAFVVSRHVLGPESAVIIGIMMAVLLTSTASAMTMAGPRILQRIGEDLPLLNWLSKTNERYIPYTAIAIQSGLAIVYVMTGSFEGVLIAANFSLASVSLITILGLFVIRFRNPSQSISYSIPWYPLPPLLFLVITTWMLGYSLFNRSSESWWGFALVISGLVLYAILKGVQRVMKHLSPERTQDPQA